MIPCMRTSHKQVNESKFLSDFVYGKAPSSVSGLAKRGSLPASVARSGKWFNFALTSKGSLFRGRSGGGGKTFRGNRMIWSHFGGAPWEHHYYSTRALPGAEEGLKGWRTQAPPPLRRRWRQLQLSRARLLSLGLRGIVVAAAAAAESQVRFLVSSLLR